MGQFRRNQFDRHGKKSRTLHGVINHILNTRVREPGLLLVHKMIERREKMCTM